MSEIILGKRHNYQPNDADNFADRAKQLGFSAEEIVELARLYGANIEEADTAGKSLKLLGLAQNSPVRD